ncbi:RNA polymerase sigma factor [Actinomadura decatromicini]|uniref:RNA polymerase sigma factor n=1 Tax=Actinomadura decatromicini TaxID=2604572 RepID=UPI00319E97C2
MAETFLAAFRQRDRYDLARRDARPWLYGIATNLVGRYVRDEVRQLRAVQRGGRDVVSEPFTDRSDERVSAQAHGRRLAGALASLPEGHRDALLLVVWGGLTYPEAAVALEVRVGTVRSRVSRARKRLRRELGAIDPTVFVKEETVHG